MATDLFGCLGLDELLVDLLGLLRHLHGGLGFLVVLTGHPKLDVLLAELGAQEAAEAGEPICRGAEPWLSTTGPRGVETSLSAREGMWDTTTGGRELTGILQELLQGITPLQSLLR